MKSSLLQNIKFIIFNFRKEKIEIETNYGNHIIFIKNSETQLRESIIFSIFFVFNCQLIHIEFKTFTELLNTCSK